MKLNKSRATILPMACVAMAAFSWVTLADELNADTTFSFPRIKDHGTVVRLPDAADQPRDSSKICVDVTAGGSPDKISPAIEKVAQRQMMCAGANR